jgi:hypothetical protein
VVMENAGYLRHVYCDFEIGGHGLISDR